MHSWSLGLSSASYPARSELRRLFRISVLPSFFLSSTYSRRSCPNPSLMKWMLPPGDRFPWCQLPISLSSLSTAAMLLHTSGLARTSPIVSWLISGWRILSITLSLLSIYRKSIPAKLDQSWGNICFQDRALSSFDPFCPCWQSHAEIFSEVQWTLIYSKHHVPKLFNKYALSPDMYQALFGGRQPRIRQTQILPLWSWHFYRRDRQKMQLIRKTHSVIGSGKC